MRNSGRQTEDKVGDVGDVGEYNRQLKTLRR